MKQLGIHELIKWVRIYELPKLALDRMTAAPNGFKSAWASISSFGTLHAMIDRQPNRYGVVPFDEPADLHPDAIIVIEAMERLSNIRIVVPEGWDPIPEVEASDTKAEYLALISSLPNPVTDTAEALYLWTCGGAKQFDDLAFPVIPTASAVLNPNGTVKWYMRTESLFQAGINPNGSKRYVTHVTYSLNGYDHKRKRPKPGAIKRFRLQPDPREEVVDRIDYQIACAALDWLRKEIAHKLLDHQLVNGTSHPWIWLEDHDAPALGIEVLG